MCVGYKNYLAQVDAGKYLANDIGSTLKLTRNFPNGWKVGGYFTLTDASFDDFGEGSFDKGFYISVPTQLFYSDFRSGNISFGLHPLTKDGGALLNKHNSLISILGDSNNSAIDRDWEKFLE